MQEVDNDLLKALAEVPPMKLAAIDEAFVLLDTGLGAIFSASMARRAAINRKKRTGAEKKHYDKRKTLLGEDLNLLKGAADKELRKGKFLFKEATKRIIAPLRTQKAQETTMKMLSELAGRPSTRGSTIFRRSVCPSSGSVFHNDPNRRISFFDAKPNFDEGEPHPFSLITVDPESQIPEDPLMRDWAEEHLHLSADRLAGLEETFEFRERLSHQMLCWQTLRADKFDKLSTKPRPDADDVVSEPLEADTDGDSDEQSEGSHIYYDPTSSAHSMPSFLKEPSGFAFAQMSLFGLTHHLDAQQMRRSRTPGDTSTCDPQGIDEALHEKPKPSTAPEAGVRAASKRRGTQWGAAKLRQRSATLSHVTQLVKPAVRHVMPIQVEMPKTPRTLPSPRRLPSRGQARDAPLGVALRVPPPFVEPHFEISSASVGHTPELTYLRCCEAMGLVPCPAVWRNFGHGRGIIDASRRSLSDADVCAILEAVAQLAADGHKVKVLDFSINSLTDVTMHYVASFVFSHGPACRKLNSISLAGNAAIRFVAGDALLDFSQALSALPALESLDLSGVPLHGVAACKLCENLQESLSLKRLNFSGCGLGRSDEAECVAAAALVGGRQGGTAGLEAYDLSCNFFSSQGFSAAAEALQGSKLSALSFAGNCISCKSSSNCDNSLRFNAMQLFLEGLHFNTGLQELDLSSCGMGPDTAFVMEDALRGHPALTSLDLADNPLGDAGVRCVLRLLLQPKPDITECNIGNHRESDATACPMKYRHAQPTGMYNLDLRYPHERSTLRMLLRTCDTALGYPLRYFKFDLKQAKPEIKHIVIPRPTWVTPSQGIWSFSFQPPLSESALQFSLGVGQQVATNDHLRNEPGVMANATPSRSGSPASGHYGGAGNSRRQSLHPYVSETPSQSGSAFVVPSGSPALQSPSASPRVSDTGFDTMDFGSLDMEARVVAPRPSVAYSARSSLGSSPRSGVVGFSARSSLNAMSDHLMEEQLASLKQTAGMFDADWGEVTQLMTSARMQVPALMYPLIRKMFLSFITLDQQIRFIHACSKDLAFNGPQVSQLCEDRPELATQTVCALFPSLRGRTPQLLLLNTSAVASFPGVARDVSRCLWFQEGNVTGRYNLDLEKPCDYAVAENCLISNAWESEVGRLLAWPDISQRGTYEMLRNEAHNEVKFDFTRDWMLPSHGTFRFDYSSIRRPPSGVSVMSESGEVTRYLNRNILRASSDAKVKALRAVSVHMYLTAQQFRNLILCFPSGELRQEMFCCFHARVIDALGMLSPDVFYCSTLFSNKERVSLLERVGPLHLLNPIHPERVWYRCHLTMYEQRMVINFLVHLQSKEPGGKINGRGTKEYRHGPVPASWAKEGVPDTDHIIICTYEAKHPNATWRRELAHRFCVGQF